MRNDLDGLVRTIASILSSDLEGVVSKILVVDGYSTDGSSEYSHKLAKSCETVQVIDIHPNGIYDAMNHALKFIDSSFKNSGESVLFLNAGDFLMDGSGLKRLNEFAIRSHWATGHAIVTRFSEYPKYTKPTLSYEDQVIPNPNDFWIPHQALAVNFADLKTVGYFDLNYQLASDYDFMVRFWSEYGPPKVLQDVVACQILVGRSNIRTFSGYKEKNRIAVSFGFKPLKLNIKTLLKWWLKEVIFLRFPRLNPQLSAKKRLNTSFSKQPCHERFDFECPWCQYSRLDNFGLLFDWR